MGAIDASKLTQVYTSVEYPYFFIPHPDATTPGLVTCLRQGDVPLLMEYKGVRKVVARISKSARNVDLMIRVAESVYYITDEKEARISSVEDYLREV